jgi:hypothetical protein
MSSVDDLHTNYAINTQLVESYNADYHIKGLDTRAVSGHVLLLDYVPKPEDMVKLFGSDRHRRWACFMPPPNFSQTRVSFFDSFASLEMDEADLHRIVNINCKNVDPNEQKARESEKKIIQNFCDLKIRLRSDYNFIMGRIHEFVRG